MRSQFLKGIYSPFVKKHVISKEPTTEQQLVDHAMTAVGIARENYSLNTGEVASLDGLASTTLSNKYLIAYNEVEPMQVDKIEKVAEERSCYKCNKKGHLARNCRSNVPSQRRNYQTDRYKPKSNNKQTGIICHYCQKPGHKRPECRKLAKDRSEGKVEKDKKKPTVKKMGEPREEDSEEEDDFGQEFVNALFDGPDFRPPAASERHHHN